MALTKDEAQGWLRDTATQLLEDAACGDVWAARWTAERIANYLEREDVLAAYGKKLIWEGMRQRMVDIGEEK